jgi:hypothetical protein
MRIRDDGDSARDFCRGGEGGRSKAGLDAVSASRVILSRICWVVVKINRRGDDGWKDGKVM